MRQFSRHRRPQGPSTRGQPIRFWGRHAVLAALANPERTVKRIWGTREALGQLDLPPVIPISYADVTDLARLVARDAPRIAAIASYRMPGLSARAQLIQFDMAGISVSAGSACSSGSLKTSHVLHAMGWDEAVASEVVRVSFGPQTHEGDVDRFLAAWTAMAARARR